MFYMRSKIYFVNNHYYLKYANDINMRFILKFYFGFIQIYFFILSE